MLNVFCSKTMWKTFDISRHFSLGLGTGSHRRPSRRPADQGFPSQWPILTMRQDRLDVSQHVRQDIQINLRSMREVKSRSDRSKNRQGLTKSRKSTVMHVVWRQSVILGQGCEDSWAALVWVQYYCSIGIVGS